MLGGEWFDDLGEDPGTISTNDITRIALESLRDHMGVTEEPSNIVARIHKVYEDLCVTVPKCLCHQSSVTFRTV